MEGVSYSKMPAQPRKSYALLDNGNPGSKRSKEYIPAGSAEGRGRCLHGDIDLDTENLHKGSGLVVKVIGATVFDDFWDKLGWIK